LSPIVRAALALTSLSLALGLASCGGAGNSNAPLPAVSGTPTSAASGLPNATSSPSGPSPAASASSVASATPLRSPSPVATPTAGATTAPATATPSHAPTAVPTATPSHTPTAVPTATPVATPTATPTAKPSPTATATAGTTATPTAAASGPLSSDIDWPTFAFNSQRSGENTEETTLTTNNVGNLTLLWSYKIGDSTSEDAYTQPIVAANVTVGSTKEDIVYVGDEHGYFAAVNAVTGAAIWSKQLGVEVTPGCGDIADHNFGITSAPAIDRTTNRIYVVDGLGILWAFDLATGNVASGWPATGLQVVDNPTVDYVYSAVNLNATKTTAYITTASYCDEGTWHGAARAINTASATVAQTFYFATQSNVQPPTTSGSFAGDYGGGIWGWGGLAVDPTTGDLFGGTSNIETNGGLPFSNAIVELNAQLTAALSQNNPSDPTDDNDDDFGGAVTLYSGPDGVPCVAALRKDGFLYVLNRTNLTSPQSPTEAIQIAAPPHSIDSPVYSTKTGLLYIENPAASETSPVTYPHALLAFTVLPGCTINPTPVWTLSQVASSISPPSVANGILFGIDGQQLYAFNAATGQQLWASVFTQLGGSVSTAPTIVNGRLYVVDAGTTGADHLYAFGLPGPTLGAAAARRR